MLESKVFAEGLGGTNASNKMTNQPAVKLMTPLQQNEFSRANGGACSQERQKLFKGVRGEKESGGTISQHSGVCEKRIKA